jgi:allene oxide cyclase
MHKRWIAVATAVAACAAGSVILTVARADAHTTSGRHAVRPAYAATGRFTVVEHAVTDTVVDIGPKGDSRGDLLAFANPVFNAANTKKVGSDNGSCVRTTPGKAWECEWTLLLRRGHLVVQGPFYDTADSVLAITGGTGVWARARGEMVLHARNAQGTAYDFRYHVTR